MPGRQLGRSQDVRQGLGELGVCPVEDRDTDVNDQDSKLQRTTALSCFVPKVEVLKDSS